MLAATQGHGQVRLVTLLTSQTGDQRIDHVVGTATVIRELVFTIVPCHATHQFSLVTLGFDIRLRYDNVFLVICQGNVDMISTRIIKSKFSDIGLDECSRVFLKEEWIRQVLHDLKIDFMSIRCPALSIIEY
jgi:hypothetical protein